MTVPAQGLGSGQQRRARRALPAPLGLALGGTVAVLLLLARHRQQRRAKRQRALRAKQQRARAAEGAAVELQLPLPPKGPSLPPTPPPGQLRVVMADVTLPVPARELWERVFGSSARFLEAFHEALGDRDIQLSPWRQPGAGAPARRTLSYATPLTNPLGPRQALNSEVMEAAVLGARCFVLTTRCTTEGVPFAGNFANYLQWVAREEAAGSTRLVISGECRFHNQVWGPLRGKIESESIQGMSKAYAQFGRMILEELGCGSGTSGPPAAAAGSTRAKKAWGGDAATGTSGGMFATPRASLSLMLDGSGGQHSTATLVTLLVLFVLVYRLSLGDVVAVQMLRRLTGQALAGSASAAP